jgi:hypothetical protein
MRYYLLSYFWTCYTSFNISIKYIHPYPFAILLIALGRSREFNWGLPFSKPEVVWHSNQSAVKEDCFNLLLLGMRSFLPGKPKAPTLEEIQELKESVPNSPKFRPQKSITA